MAPRAPDPTLNRRPVPASIWRPDARRVVPADAIVHIGIVIEPSVAEPFVVIEHTEAREKRT